MLYLMSLAEIVIQSWKLPLQFSCKLSQHNCTIHNSNLAAHILCQSAVSFNFSTSTKIWAVVTWLICRGFSSSNNQHFLWTCFSNLSCYDALKKRNNEDFCISLSMIKSPCSVSWLLNYLTGQSVWSSSQFLQALKEDRSCPWVPRTCRRWCTESCLSFTIPAPSSACQAWRRCRLPSKRCKISQVSFSVQFN